ncbi:phage holin family protein [Maribacter sp. ACAM166]|uniref:phage holin family protein n=1 Tax=Maribacter sp. ACAM166 TaxID=2508996 RepID=UPI0010FCF72B|nr:phage holin family protein [Maribacter sp. ACAM166]TLP77277.1 phage holin family protein [Maribacter sp. ACAM166]
MAFEEFKQDLSGLEADMRSYIEHSDEYLRLKIFKVLMHYITGIVKFLMIGTGFVFALLFLSFAACLAMSEALSSYLGGFLIVGGFYIVVAILLYLFRERLNEPVIKKVSKYYFD